MEGLTIYRELAPTAPRDLIEWLDARDQLFQPTDAKGVERTFVENDFPRPSEITREIVGDEPGMGSQYATYPGCTIGFAVFDQQGQFVAEFRSLDRAQRAVAGAKVQLAVDIDVPDEEELE